MILIDFNGIAVGTLVMQKLEANEHVIRHVILNILRMYNKKFRDQYGSMVICTEGYGNWRKKKYPQYKFKRRSDREESHIDWSEVYRIISMVTEEIKENLPWYVINVDDTEADDVIAHIALSTQEFGQHEDVVIVSSDKDFLQLQEYTKNIRQFSPMRKGFIDQKDKFDLHEHICRGDSSDGIPNIMSGDDVFVEGIRQTPMTKKNIEEWRDTTKMPGEIYRNYLRNHELIDLRNTPRNIQMNIIDAWQNRKCAHPSKTLNYLVKKRCRNLIECVGDFKNA